MNRHWNKIILFILGLFVGFTLGKIINPPCSIIIPTIGTGLIFNIIHEYAEYSIKSIIKRRILKAFFLFMVGGATYGMIEIGFRGYTDTSMVVVGGLCFILIGLINELTTMSIITQMLISACIVTILEFISGYILNIILGMNIWDYSDMPYNLYGQVCLLFSIMWIGLSGFAIILDDTVRYLVFNEKYPKYYL